MSLSVRLKRKVEAVGGEENVGVVIGQVIKRRK
jgi:hypothetical protein